MECERCVEMELRVAELEQQIKEAREHVRRGGGIAAHSEDVRAVFAYWQNICGHPKAKLSGDRATKIRARLREGYSVNDLKDAVLGARQGAYVDPRGRKWDDISLICRSGTNVERFMGFAQGDDHLRIKVLG